MRTKKPKHPGYLNGSVEFNCEYCGKKAWDKKSHYKRKKKHYCSMKCYGLDRKNNWTKEMQPTWTGGVSQTESHRRWKDKNPERMKHLKARRYARKKGAKGSHTLEEWNAIKKLANYKCVYCGLKKKLTKDHIIPLSEGGSDYISNIQPLCRNCNSKKWKHIHETPELLNSEEEETGNN